MPAAGRPRAAPEKPPISTIAIRPRQRFRALLQQLRRGITQDEKSRPSRFSIRQNPENGEKIRMALDFIDQDQPAQ
jgi:hypothetical protein